MRTTTTSDTGTTTSLLGADGRVEAVAEAVMIKMKKMMI